jgi:Fe-Mn family superoxide dismutase
MFVLADLPYAHDALAPHISERTMQFHHGKHHRSYVEKLNAMVKDTVFENMDLVDVVQATGREAKQQALFNNAAQAWNHEFFWHCMSPGGGGEPSGDVAGLLRETFGAKHEDFHKAFVDAATGRFGSGWAWLVQNGDDTLGIETTANADCPLLQGKVPLLACDVWEHAYYLDYQNDRGAFVEAFLDHLVNWEFVAENLKAASSGGEHAQMRTAGSLR